MIVNAEARIATLEADNTELREVLRKILKAWDLCKGDIYIRRPVPSNHQHALAYACESAEAALGKDGEESEG